MRRIPRKPHSAIAVSEILTNLVSLEARDSICTRALAAVDALQVRTFESGHIVRPMLHALQLGGLTYAAQQF